MVSFEEIQATYYMVAATGVLVAAVYYILNMRATLQTRQAQLFIQLYTIFTSYEFKTKWNEIMNVWEWDDFEDFNAKYGLVSNPAEFSKFDLVGTFFEGIGVLIKRGLIDVTLVDDLMSGHIVWAWEKFEPLVKDYRIVMNWPQCLEWWEYLYHEVKNIMEKQHPELSEKEIGTRARTLRQE